jgi:hypothetical protein
VRSDRRLDNSWSQFSDEELSVRRKYKDDRGCRSIAGLFMLSIGTLAIHDRISYFLKGLSTPMSKVCVHLWKVYRPRSTGRRGCTSQSESYGAERFEKHHSWAKM